MFIEQPFPNIATISLLNPIDRLNTSTVFRSDTEQKVTNIQFKSSPRAAHSEPQRSEKGSDELPEAGVGEDTAVQVRAVQLGCADRHRGNRSVGR